MPLLFDITKSAISPGGHATTRAFDAPDRAVPTVVPDAGATTYVYDSMGRMLAEYRSSATNLRAEYIYLTPNEVFAQLVTDPQSTGDTCCTSA
jgi:hypothetical protein